MSDGKVTEVLAKLARGERAASDELLPLVYDELRRLAHCRMAREGSQTLQPTALVHEAYLRLLSGDELGWDGLGHFFAAAARAMRRILIERARRVARQRHGGALRFVELRPDLPRPASLQVDELLALDEALERLAERDPPMARVVELVAFAGLTQRETAAALGLSERTVRRSWSAARAWLGRELRDRGGGSDRGPAD